MLSLQPTDLASFTAENILLLGVIGALLFLALIRKMMRDSIQAQIDSFDNFKLEIIKTIGQTIARLEEIKRQADVTSETFKKRIEDIEHNQVNREDFIRENTILKSSYADLARYMSDVSIQLSNLKNLIIQKDATRSSISEKN